MDDEGVVNSAVLLMALGEDTASEVFKHLGPKEVQRIGEAMAKLKTTTREKVDEVLDKFESEAGRNGSLVEDTDHRLF